MTRLIGLALPAIFLAFATATPVAIAGPGSDVALFKVVTLKDEIVIGLTGAQLGRIEGHDAPGIARALQAQGVLEVWEREAKLSTVLH